jgi:hypothetical protein
VSEAIHQGDQGDAVRVFQRHLNDRLRARGEQPVPVNGKAGPKLIERTAFAAWFLGALTETVKSVQGGTIPVGVQQIIVAPETREPAQLRRARERRGKLFAGVVPTLEIITTAQWGAKPAAAQIKRVGTPSKFIFHHTDGHAPQLDGAPGETLEEAKAYARSIQNDHMHRDPPFIDSGHNFLVTRSGHVLEGRHGSLEAIKAGGMVDSAHCIGQNHHPGIEHEHRGNEQMTDAQREASLRLHEFICRHTGIKPTEIHPHRKFDSTDCPAELEPAIAGLRADLAQRLTP